MLHRGAVPANACWTRTLDRVRLPLVLLGGDNHQNQNLVVHGSAPDIAGMGIASPKAMLLSAAMMLEWLGGAASAARIRLAVAESLRRGETTLDLGGSLLTIQMVDRILHHMENLPG